MLIKAKVKSQNPKAGLWLFLFLNFSF